jgi:hypothetical protein
MSILSVFEKKPVAAERGEIEERLLSTLKRASNQALPLESLLRLAFPPGGPDEETMNKALAILGHLAAQKRIEQDGGWVRWLSGAPGNAQ